MADFFLSRSSEFHNCTALELGCGSGLAGLVLAQVAERVYLTDVGNKVLSNCQV